MSDAARRRRVAEAAARMRGEDAAKRRLQDRLETWGVNVGGRSLLSTPLRRPGDGGGPPPSVWKPYGETVTLVAQDVEVPVGGGKVEFTGSWGDMAGFHPVEVPTSDVEVSVDAYYDVHVSFGWDSWVGGGTVEVLRDDQTVWGPDVDPSWSATFGSSFGRTAPKRLIEAGQSFAVWVDHGDTQPRTLASVTVTVGLVEIPAEHRIMQEGGPWAWYRGDDLSGYTDGDPVTGWDDRSGNGRHLTMPTVQAPRYTADALDGIPGIRGWEQFTDGGLWTPVDPEPFADGVTVIEVFKAPDHREVDSLLGSGDGAIFFGFQTSSQQWRAYNFGEVSGNDPAHDNDRWHVAYGQYGPDVAVFEVDGQPYPDSNPWVPTAAQWEGMTPIDFVQVVCRSTESFTAEYIVFDRLLTSGERDEWMGYVAGRFPSLGLT